MNRSIFSKNEGKKLGVFPAPSLNSSLRAFDLDCDVVDDYFDHEF